MSCNGNDLSILPQRLTHQGIIAHCCYHLTMSIPRALQAISYYHWYRWTLIAALGIYALLTVRAALVIPYAQHVRMNYGDSGGPGADFWTGAAIAVGIGSLVLAVLVWLDREVVQRVRWWVLAPAILVWLGIAGIYGLTHPTDVGYPYVRILWTSFAGILSLILLSVAIGRVPDRPSSAPKDEPPESAESNDRFTQRRRNGELDGLRVLATALVVTAAALAAIWGSGRPRLEASTHDLGGLEITGTYAPVGNACLLTDMRPVLDLLELEPRVDDYTIADEPGSRAEDHFTATCEILPAEWATEFSLADPGAGEFNVQEHPGMYLATLEVRANTTDIFEYETPEAPCESAQLSDGTEYWICREDSYEESDLFGDMGVYGVRYLVANTLVHCRFGDHEVPNRTTIIEALDEVCLEALETVHDAYQR